MPENHDEDLEHQFQAGLTHFLQRIASVITALGICGVVLWAVAKPYLNEYFEGQLEPLTKAVLQNSDQLEETTRKLVELKSDVQEVQEAIGKRRPVVEIFSIGLVAGAGPFHPGDTVPIEYLLRRNSNCPTEIVVQFKNRFQRRILTNHTYVIPSTPAPASFAPRTFTADVLIPDRLPPGWYSYQPIMRPDRSECPGQEDIVVTPSLYFEVVATN